MTELNKRRAWFFGTLFALLVLLQTPLLVWALRITSSSREAATRAEDIRGNTPGLVIAFLIAFYWDVVRGKLGDHEKAVQLSAMTAIGNSTVEQIEEQVNRLADTIRLEPLERTSERDLIRAALRRKLGSTPGSIENLVTMVVGREAAPHILNCEVRHVLKRDPDDSRYFAVHRDQTGLVELSQYVLALTATDVANEWIAYDCPLVFDTWHVGDREALNINRKVHVQNTWISYLEGGRDFTRSRRAYLTEVPQEDWPDYLGGGWADFADDLALLRAVIPPTTDPITIHTETLLPIETNYCFWAADCPTFVETISFDISDLSTAHPEGTLYSLVPFLGCTTDIQTGNGQTDFRTRPHNWLVKGQGAMLTWHQPKGLLQ